MMRESPIREGEADTRDVIDFYETVGVLWLTLYTWQQRKRPRAADDSEYKDNERNAKNALNVLKSADAEEVKRQREGGEAPASHHPVPAAAASVDTPASADAAFRLWGEVDWVLLAAHVYQLTRRLFTDAAVRTLVVEEVFDRRFQRDAHVMLTQLDATRNRLLLHHAAEAEAEAAEHRSLLSGVVAGPAATASMANAAAAGSAGSLTRGGLAASAATTLDASSPPLDGAASHASGETASALRGGSVGQRGPQTPITAGITQQQQQQQPSSGPSFASTSPSYNTTPGGMSTTTTTTTTTGVGQPDAAGRAAVGVGATPRDSPAPGQSPPPHAGESASREGGSDRPVMAEAQHSHSSHREGQEGGALRLQQREGHTSPLLSRSDGPGDKPFFNADGVPGNLSASAAAPAITGSNDGVEMHNSSSARAANAALHATPAPAASTAPPFIEPDPLDAAWYPLWCSLPSAHARRQLQHLRFHTPLPLEDFSSLLEQFFLVEGADDFLNPVHAATIMEFAGVRSGPYHTIVRAPLSLAEVRRYITESHRHYARVAAAAASAAAASAGASGHAETKLNTPTPTTSSTSPPPGGAHHPHHHRPPQREHVDSVNERVDNPQTGSAETAALLSWTSSHERRVLTIAELERSIWHIAANCVVFNAPESRYPRTARRFAAACIDVITRYCEKQMAAFLAA